MSTILYFVAARDTSGVGGDTSKCANHLHCTFQIQSDHHHQHPNNPYLKAGCPSRCPTNSVIELTEGWTMWKLEQRSIHTTHFLMQTTKITKQQQQQKSLTRRSIHWLLLGRWRVRTCRVGCWIFLLHYNAKTASRIPGARPQSYKYVNSDDIIDVTTKKPCHFYFCNILGFYWLILVI